MVGILLLGVVATAAVFMGLLSAYAPHWLDDVTSSMRTEVETNLNRVVTTKALFLTEIFEQSKLDVTLLNVALEGALNATAIPLVDGSVGSTLYYAQPTGKCLASAVFGTRTKLATLFSARLLSRCTRSSQAPTESTSTVKL